VRLVDAEGDAERVRVELPRLKVGGTRRGVAGVSVASILLSIGPREGSCEWCFSLPLPPMSLFLSVHHRQHRARQSVVSERTRLVVAWHRHTTSLRAATSWAFLDSSKRERLLTSNSIQPVAQRILSNALERSQMPVHCLPALVLEDV
jgi:hypothetical protein